MCELETDCRWQNGPWSAYIYRISFAVNEGAIKFKATPIASLVLAERTQIVIRCPFGQFQPRKDRYEVELAGLI